MSKIIEPISEDGILLLARGVTLGKLFNLLCHSVSIFNRKIIVYISQDCFEG